MRRAHGEEAVALAKKYKLGYVFTYAEHSPGRLAGQEEKCIPIAAAEAIARANPWMIYVDYEAPRRCWWKPWTWFCSTQEEHDAADPTR